MNQCNKCLWEGMSPTQQQHIRWDRSQLVDANFAAKSCSSVHCRHSTVSSVLWPWIQCLNKLLCDLNYFLCFYFLRFSGGCWGRECKESLLEFVVLFTSDWPVAAVCVQAVQRCALASVIRSASAVDGSRFFSASVLPLMTFRNVSRSFLLVISSISGI